jgi:YHS domain-containing protein
MEPKETPQPLPRLHASAFAGPEAQHANQGGEDVRHRTNEEQRPDENLVFDIVCGQLVDTDATEHETTFQDEKYFFCCAKCKSAFDAHPERYVRSDAYGPFH